MKATTAVLCPESDALTRSRLVDYVALTKPRIALLVLFTVAAGAMLAGGPALTPLLVLHTVLGTALVAAGASSLNQLLERHTDALMQRTENRPLPAGRLQPMEVLVFGTLMGVIGIAWLALALKQPCAPLVAAFTFAAYVWIYTPLKRQTPWNTLIGAVPGALPPVIGWTAVTGTLDLGAAALFLIVFLWQMPHFLAIAWIYRDDYARAGMRMIPVGDRGGVRTRRHMVAFALALVPAALLPMLLHRTGPVYLVGAVLLGLWFLATTIAFARDVSTARARRVLRASLVYLPGLLAVLLLDVVARTL